jgi:Heterokaryon incompatibility protein (HET)
MRLINAKTLELEEFYGSHVPPYGALSHIWEFEADEVSFQDMSAHIPAVKEKPGFAKIKDVCEQALIDGLNYVWVDTTCIDKTSSAELGEAVNSMFSWFQCSTICYVYLSDISSQDNKELFSFDGPFSNSSWFTRSWTLLELIAPPFVHFFDCDWKFIGTKKSLEQRLSDVTRIPSSCLIGSAVPDDYSIAERMSWASIRITTRVEDMAYSLMGLFGVNMPIIYGEGKEAFRRLQEEILMRTNDQSFLAWRNADSIEQLDSRDLSLCPVFAETPAYFPMRPAKVLKYLGPGNVRQHMIIRSNIGITIWAPVIDTLSDRLVFAELNCVTNSSNVWVPLWKTERQSYYRVNFPSMTLYRTGNLKSPWIEPSKLCLEEPVLASDSSTDFLSLNISNSNSSMKPAVERTVQETEAAVEVLFALLDGKQVVSKSAVHMYPPLPPSEENHLGSLQLCRRGDGYYHGIVVFKLDSNLQNKTVALFLAACVLQGDLRAWTCRVLLDLDESSSADFETVSKSELAKICNDEKVPSDSRYFESSIWRDRDQNGKTIVELVENNRVIIAKVMFDALSRDNHLSASIIAAFEKSKEMKEVVSRASSMSMSRG